MDSTWIPAAVSFVIAIITAVLTSAYQRRDLKIRMEQLNEQVTASMIANRIKAYENFFSNLEMMSTIHDEQIVNNPDLVRQFGLIFQEAIYSPTGLLASSDTRQILVYARKGCLEYSTGKIDHKEWRQRIWAVHLALRSDLGIMQPNWPSEVERLRNRIIADSSDEIEKRVKGTNHLSF